MKAQLKGLLAARRKLRIEDANRVAAAVLVPIYKDGERHHIVFIRRTLTVKKHKGQISFPGGSRETGDRTLLDTALRESAEEIGLRPEDAEVLGELDDEVTTTSDYLVTPFVAAMPWPYRFTINSDEVDKIITVPIHRLLEKGNLTLTTELLEGRLVESYAYHYRGQVIWGATARILNKFLNIVAAIPPGT
jgi:8-oxo-dGTP pyrophosphatase MutT (NUDIX family)